MTSRQKQWDVIVIGGGPSGMMAAGRAAELGARVLILEKNESLGKKLRITGGGRCNMTNAIFDIHEMAKKYGEKGKFLLPSLSRFGVQDTLDFFHGFGLNTKLEEGNRVFPKSDRADDVWGVMVEYVFKNKVEIRYNAPVVGFEIESNIITGVKLANKEVLCAKYFVLAVGGKSHPETGSTGDGFMWLEAIGHTVNYPDLALVPVTIQNVWVKKLQGIALSHAKISVVHKGKKQKGFEGKLLFTHFGVSGPLVLNMSQRIKEYFKTGKTELSLDIFPGEDTSVLDKKLQSIFLKYQNKKIKNVLGEFMLPMLVESVLDLSGIDPEKPIHDIARGERLRILDTVKDMRMQVSGFLGPDKAVVSSGGVELKEVDFKTMQSRLYSNLFLTGDILDFNRPSGGFSLQICWTTGRIAGDVSGRMSHE